MQLQGFQPNVEKFPKSVPFCTCRPFRGGIHGCSSDRGSDSSPDASLKDFGIELARSDCAQLRRDLVSILKKLGFVDDNFVVLKMTATTQDNPKKTVVLKKMMKVMNSTRFTNFCCIFTLRQGTILIAIAELTLTLFSFFLLMLAAVHARDINNLVNSDMRDLEEATPREIALMAVFINNEKKLLLGQHLAYVLTFVIWAGLLLTCINFIFCSLLLYGAIKNSPKFLLPWTSTVLFSMIAGCFFIIALALAPFQECKVGIFVGTAIFYALEVYAWLIVTSFYKELKAKRIEDSLLADKEKLKFSAIKIHIAPC